MIKVKILKKNNSISKITINGHADYDLVGKDIVCSAVSSIVITTINGIIEIDSEAIKYSENQDQLEIEILKKDLVIDKLIVNMVNLLMELSEKYPKNIMIKEGVSNE